jgi:hypothetical protein
MLAATDTTQPAPICPVCFVVLTAGVCRRCCPVRARLVQSWIRDGFRSARFVWVDATGEHRDTADLEMVKDRGEWDVYIVVRPMPSDVIDALRDGILRAYETGDDCDTCWGVEKADVFDAALAAWDTCHGCGEVDDTIDDYTVTHHDGTRTAVRYCNDCRDLAKCDWNGETAAIAPVHAEVA